MSAPAGGGGAPGSPSEFELLRRRAEALVAGLGPEETGRAVDLPRLLHEIAVAHAELELQNETLREARGEVEESRDRYVEMFDFAPVGLAELDRLGRIEKANLLLAELLGVERTVLAHVRLSRYVADEDVEEYARFRRRIGSSPIVADLHLVSWEGERIPVRLAAVEVPGRTLVAVSDRREVRLHAEAKRLAETRYRDLFESLPVASFAIDRSWWILAMNPAALAIFGVHAEQVVGRNLQDLVGGAEALLDGIRKAMAWNRPEVLVETIAGPAGGERVFEVHVDPTEEGLSIVMIDVTTRRHAEELRKEFVRRLLQHQDEDRRHLAGELHDAIGQSIAAISLGLHDLSAACLDAPAKEALEHVTELCRATTERFRHLSYRLHPVLLDEHGLGPSVERLAVEQGSSSGIPISVRAGDVGELPQSVALSLFRIVQEAITNAVLHARPSRILVEIARRDRSIRVTVSDDGLGFDPKARRQVGLGLRGMRERASYLGGTLEIDSAPARGTTVTAVVPAS